MLHPCRRQAGPHPAEVSEASWLPKFMNLALKSPVSQQRPSDRAEKVQREALFRSETFWQPLKALEAPGRPLGGPWEALKWLYPPSLYLSPRSDGVLGACGSSAHVHGQPRLGMFRVQLKVYGLGVRF